MSAGSFSEKGMHIINWLQVQEPELVLSPGTGQRTGFTFNPLEIFKHRFCGKELKTNRQERSQLRRLEKLARGGGGFGYMRCYGWILEILLCNS